MKDSEYKRNMEIIERRRFPKIGLTVEITKSPAGFSAVKMSESATGRTLSLVLFSFHSMAEARFAAEVAKAERSENPGRKPRLVKQGTLKGAA